MKMKGFFSQEEVSDFSDIALEDNSLPNCVKCGLDTKCTTPKMKVSGEGRLNCLVIAEASGANEDQQGTQLIGDAGQLFRKHLARFKLDLDRDFWKMNAVSCRPTSPSGANRPPTKTEVQCCKPFVESTIQKLKPKVIWLLGSKAVDSFYMNRFKTTAIGRWRGLCIPDQMYNAWVVPQFHPSYINRSSKDLNLLAAFQRDLRVAAMSLRKPPVNEVADYDQSVDCLYEAPDVLNRLRAIKKKAASGPITIVLDYETNALKSQWPNSKVVVISLYPEGGVPFSFAYQYLNHFTPKELLQLKTEMRQLFQHQNIWWVAHNVQFEDIWTRSTFGVRPKNWLWDTMVVSHLLDNRRDFTSLKFQAYVNFGVEPYDREIKPYLEAYGKSPYNKVEQIPLPKLLTYGGLDVKYTMKLFKKQQEEFTLTDKLYPKNKLAAATKLFHLGTLALSDIHEKGILIDTPYYQKQDKLVGVRLDKLKKELQTGEEAKKFLNETGKELDLQSPKDLGNLFYSVLGADPIYTKKENLSVDAKALKQLRLPFVDKLLEMRRLEKVKNTYFAQLLREVCSSKIHPFFGLNIARSFRSSSQSPNWQNQPSHHEESGKLVRSGILPPQGWKIAELDYKSIEVRVAAVYTKDPSLIKYVMDDSTDMHRDSACDVWILPQEEVTKAIRFNMKGGWVFSQFYGSYYANCAKDLWETCIEENLATVSGVSLRQHLKDQKIKSYDAFVEHCKSAEDIFWNQRFKVYKKWKEDINALYRYQGYLETYYGFRFTGYMTEKEATNYPIQSTAFHILLESLIEIIKIAWEEEWQSYIIGQIHDSILMYVHPEEEDHVLKTCVKIMSEEVKNRHDWITVPIPVEIEMSDKSWWDKKEIIL